MTNSARGEKSFTLGGVKILLTLEHERIVELEDLTGVGLLALAGRVAHLLPSEDRDPLVTLMQSPLTFGQIVDMIWVLCGKTMTQEQLGNLILRPDVGVTEVFAPLNDFLVDAIAGAPMGEPEAGEQEESEDNTQSQNT